jgi:membrane-bound metal-dependent hydrolase YbcI (DUF457 family)
VDVVSHLAFGRALVALAHPHQPAPSIPRRALTAAIVVGAIAPDVDAVLMPFGWDRYLVWHERGTHTLLGALLVAALLASLIRFVIQPLLRRPAALRPPWLLVWLAAIAGCASHLLLDGICGGSLHLLWPLSDARLTFSLVAMADPLLAGPLVLFLIAAAIWRRRAFELALVLLVVMTTVVGAKAVSRAAALRVYRADHVGLTPTLEARWGSPTRWYAYDRTATNVRAWLVDTRSGDVSLYVEHKTYVRPETQALIDASRRLDTVRRAIGLFEYVFPEVVDREDGTVDVLWSDIRFCRPSTCDLRFGGRFDRAGRALEQVVLIGTVRQSRSVDGGH